MKLKKPHLLTFGALALVMPASADVIYSNLQDIAIPATFDGLYLNVETGVWNTPSNLGAGVAGWDVNPFSGGKAFANSPDFQPVRSGTGSSSPILNLAAGVTVGSSSTYSTFVQGVGGQNPGQPGYGSSQMLTGLGGNFTAGTEGYIGFRLNGTDYGSMRVVLTNNTSGAMIRDWAYDDTGAAIKTDWIKTDIVSPTARTVTLNPGTGEAFTLGSQLADASGSITNSLVKDSSGTTVLSQTNTYTGATNVNGGTLSLGHATNTLANTGAVNVNGGILALGANSDTVGSVSLASGSITGSGTLTAATYSLTGGTLAAQLGAGAVTVNGAVTFSAAGRLNAASTLLIQGGTLTLTGDETVASFQQTGGTIAGGFGINSASDFELQSGTLSGKMGGNGGLKKRGGGKTTITGNNTYTGATDIMEGTLLVNGSTAAGSTVAVSAGATLGGTGTIGGAVNVSGVLSPGASIETLNTGTLSLANGSSLVHELNSGVATVVGSDLLVVTGNLNLTGTVGLTLSDLTTPNVAFNVNDVFSIINYTGTWNGGLFTFGGNELANAEEFSFGLNTWRIDYNAPTGGLNFAGEYAGGSDSFVNLTVIPEPDIAALIGAFGAILLLRRKR